MISVMAMNQQGSNGVSVDVFSRDVTDQEIRQETLRICQLYVNGIWDTFTYHDITLEKMCGMSNYVFKVTAPKPLPPLLLRIHGSAGHELVIESVTASILAERNVGPRLFGIFPEGRLEEFIQSDRVTLDNIRNSEFSKKIARKLAQFHAMTIPVMKSQWLLLNTCREYYSLIETRITPFTDRQREILAYLRDLDYEGEINFMKSCLEKSTSPIVFCHNDLQEGNMLMRHGTGDMLFIDYECSCYNYRNFDIVNHFLEWIADYEVDKRPFFTIQPELFPSEESQRFFISEHLTASGCRDPRPLEQQVDEIIGEVALFCCYSHLFYASWGVVIHHHIPFHSEDSLCYLDYAFQRLQLYFNTKKLLLC